MEQVLAPAVAATHLPTPGFTQAIPLFDVIDVASVYVPTAHNAANLAPLLATPPTPTEPFIQLPATPSTDVQEPAVTAVQPLATAPDTLL